MRYQLIIVLLLLLNINCSDINQKKNIINDLESLRTENDSLRKIVSEINNKYVFDSISFRNIINPENTNELNSNYDIEFLVVGYNPNKSYFVKFDSIVDGQKVNPDTLKQSNGGFKYSTKLTEKENTIQIEMEVKNKYGKNKSGIIYDKVFTEN